MFDIGFSELFVIGVVALVVIGPERLPKVARTVGVLFGRLQRYVTQVKSDISREMEMAELGKVKSEFENAARSFQSDMESKAAEVERDVRDAQASIERELAAKAEAPAPDAAPAPEAPASPQLELGIEPPAAAPAPSTRPAAP
ncbi:MAG TPA: Sec-independent protein translocase protein TatB [Usitatibacter sp.]|nr:Sec-independent protein translocase protein TatB [Usitatibacter sp.]